MLHDDFRRIKRWEETDDVLQNAAVRLLRAVEAVPPSSVREFFTLSALQIRRELLDLARKYDPSLPPPRSIEENNDSPHLHDGTTTLEPGRLAIWAEFHRQVEALPPEEQEVFDLLWYQGQTQAEAAQVLNVALATVKRRWLAHA
jgi:RNA polymerase sigma-70 factor (ECF subfamily)